VWVAGIAIWSARKVSLRFFRKRSPVAQDYQPRNDERKSESTGGTRLGRRISINGRK
jgi:hypothetical protein